MKLVQVKDRKSVVAVETLANEIWREYYIPIVGREQVEYMLKRFQSKKAITAQIKEGFLYYLIKNERNQYIGYCGALPKEEELFLSKVYLTAPNRGKGCGRQMIEFIEEIAQERRLQKITLTVNKNNTGAIHAYKKMGFAMTEAIVQDIGGGFFMDDYKMEKQL